jgi:trk system potassium uptake protein TrkA
MSRARRTVSPTAWRCKPTTSAGSAARLGTVLVRHLGQWYTGSDAGSGIRLCMEGFDLKDIVVGAGKLGFEVASRLCHENHDVVVIDHAAERLSEIERNLDVMAIHGNGASLRVLHEAKADEASLFIATTEHDEVNMLACILAKQMGARKTVARVREPDYDIDRTLTKSGSYPGVDVTVNPDLQAAAELARIIKNPEASEFDYLAGGKVHILSYVIAHDSPLANQEVRNLDLEASTLVALIRDGEVTIPRGHTVLLPGDKVFAAGRRGTASLFGFKAGREAGRLRTVSVIGGLSVGYYLARSLEPLVSQGVQVKVFEGDVEQCELLAEAFPRLTVVHGDGSRLEVLEDENVRQSDAAAVVSENDQSNLLTGYFLKRMGVPRVAVSVSRSEYLPLTAHMELDATVVPRVSAAATILKIARGDRVLSLALLKEARAEVLELLVPDHAPACGVALKDLEMPEGAIIGSIVREGQVIVPRGNTRIAASDHVIVFTVEAAKDSTAHLFGSR